MSSRMRRRDCRYRRNPPPPHHMRYGRRAMDANTSFPTYEGRLVTDEWGQKVDPRFGGIDTNEQKGRQA